MIWLLDLDVGDYRQFRLVWMRIVELAEQHDRDVYVQLMAFPRDLPNLRPLRPPGDNSRPHGIEERFDEMR